MKSRSTKITVETTVKAPVEKVWELWTRPEHIVHWNNASEDWCTPQAENDLRNGGKFMYRMESRDGKTGFDFEGEYDDVVHNKIISYSMSDGRKVSITFSGNGNETHLKEIFDADPSHSVDMQRDGWQAIINNFKRYAETEQHK